MSFPKICSQPKAEKGEEAASSMLRFVGSLEDESRWGTAELRAQAFCA